MRVLVTGATGFLGGAVVRRLAGRGCAVVALGRNRDRLAALAGAGVTPVAQDLSRGGLDLSGLEPVEAMVHCAALSAPSGPRAPFEAANVAGTEAALALARALGVRRFVNISTPSVYFALRDQEGVAETAPLPPPINAYAATKAAAERLVLACDDLHPISLRPRGLYGPGDTALLPRLLTAARRGPLPLLRGGRAAIDLTYISDAVDAVEAAVQAGPEVAGEVFNISGGTQLALREIVETATARAGVVAHWRAMPLAPLMALARARDLAQRTLPGLAEPRLTPYGLGLFAFRQSLDIGKAARRLGWRPQVSFAEGVARSFAGGPR